jgi:hypothetical protein
LETLETRGQLYGDILAMLLAKHEATFHLELTLHGDWGPRGIVATRSSFNRAMTLKRDRIWHYQAESSALSPFESQIRDLLHEARNWLGSTAIDAEQTNDLIAKLSECADKATTSAMPYSAQILVQMANQLDERLQRARRSRQ